jgi:flagellar biosynthesis protein FlhF
MRKDMAILKSMMTGMMITDENGLSEKLGHSTTVKLRQAGFSPEVVTELQHAFEGQAYEKGRLNFMHELARQLVRSHTEDLFEARLICVVGSSGSGKTTLATKIAAHCKETGIANNMILGTVTSERLAGETIKDHARLMNMPSVDFPLAELSIRVKETSRRMIMDVSAEPDQAVAAIRKATAALDPARVAVVQAIPGGSSSVMISHQCKLYKQLAPTIALTKLDECEATPPELCSLLTHGNGIGLLTGTKSIVGGIAIATDAILAQYLKENC